MSHAWLLGLAVGVATAQPLQTRPGAPDLDPFLWPEIADAVAEAAVAERDPTRGPGNAIARLEAEKKRHGARRLRTAIDLRIAATALRERFRAAGRFPEPVREAQALSTYARLDLAEPGLKEALLAAIEAAEGPPPELALSIAVLGKTPGLDLDAFTERLSARLDEVGVRVDTVPPAAADFVLRLGAADEPPRGDRRVVSARLELAQRGDGEATWRRGLYRSAAAASPEAALTASLEWLARMGGRDLLFRYLATGPLPQLNVLFARPSVDEHGHRH